MDGSKDCNNLFTDFFRRGLGVTENIQFYSSTKMNGLLEATTLSVEQMDHMENAFVLKPHKWLRRMFILIGQCITCANVQGRPLFQNKKTKKARSCFCNDLNLE